MLILYLFLFRFSKHTILHIWCAQQLLKYSQTFSFFDDHGLFYLLERALMSFCFSAIVIS